MSRRSACTEKDFLRDVTDHQMIVLKDDGVYRHIRFKRPQTSNMHFDLVTYPGHLVYSGDMGCYVFSRLHDMFEFFRTDREHHRDNGNLLAINPSYWSEKLQAPSHQDVMEFSPDSFRQHVKEAFDDWVTHNQPDAEYSTEAEREAFSETKNDLWEALEDDVLSSADDGDVRAFDAARDFLRVQAPSFNMDDCWEWNCREYEHRFLWCCYALAWGIQKYDEAKASQA